MKKQLALSVVIGLVCVSSSFGFNGQRQGFVLGGGLGFAPVSNWDLEYGSFNFDENGAGLGLNLIIGHAWDEQNMIVYEGNVTGWSSEDLNQTVSQGFNGAAWYHYFGTAGHSSFTTIGLGVYVFDGEDRPQNDPGIAGLAGGGFEFARHWQVGGYFSIGQTQSGDYGHYHLSILLSGVAF